MKARIAALGLAALCASVAFGQYRTTNGTVVFGPAELTGGAPNLGIGFSAQRLTNFLPASDNQATAQWFAAKFQVTNATSFNRIGLSVQTYASNTSSSVFVGIFRYSGNSATPLGAPVTPLTEMRTAPFALSPLTDVSVGLGELPSKSANDNRIKAGPGVTDLFYTAPFVNSSLAAGTYLLVIAPAAVPGGTSAVNGFAVLNTNGSNDGAELFVNQNNGVGSWRSESGFLPRFHLVANSSLPATFVGTVNLDSFDGDVTALTFTVRVNGGQAQNVTLNSNRQFSLVLAPGTYSIQVDGDRWTSATVADILVPASGPGAATFNLSNGDSDGNNGVDDADLTNLILDFGGAGGSMSGSATDFDGNGVVDDADLTILILNFGTVGN